MDSRAAEIGNGRMEISVSGDANRTVFEIKSIVLSTENDTLKQDFAVIVKMVLNNNMAKPVSVTQELWDKLMENLQKVKAPEISYVDKIRYVLYIVIIALAIAALYSMRTV